MQPPNTPAIARSQSTADARIDFLTDLARHLHAYGTTAQRLEGALQAVAQPLGIECEPWSNPTGIILSFRSMEAGNEHNVTRVVRLLPGETDLYRLAEADRIADEVIAGRMDLLQGRNALRQLDQPAGARTQAMRALGFGLAAAAVAGLLRLPWLDIGVAAATGLVIGMLSWAAQRIVRLRESFEALSGMVAGGIALLVAAYWAPLNLNTVVIASLIVLLPGLSLTNAVNELTSQHLVSGTARFAGALATVMKLAVGTMIAFIAADLCGLEAQVRASRPQSWWVEAGALLAGSYAFAVLFRACIRDYPVVMAAAIIGYLLSRMGDAQWGHPVGIFLSALATTALGNLYARLAGRPGALVRVPGIIMLVPGSIALRGLLSMLQTQDAAAVQQPLILLLGTLLALIAGLMFGSLLVPTRRYL